MFTVVGYAASCWDSYKGSDYSERNQHYIEIGSIVRFADRAVIRAVVVEWWFGVPARRFESSEMLSALVGLAPLIVVRFVAPVVGAVDNSDWIGEFD